MTDLQLQAQLTGFISQYAAEMDWPQVLEQVAFVKRQKALGALHSLLMDLSVEELRRAERVAKAASTPSSPPPAPSMSSMMHVDSTPAAPVPVKSPRRSRR